MGRRQHRRIADPGVPCWRLRCARCRCAGAALASRCVRRRARSPSAATSRRRSAAPASRPQLAAPTTPASSTTPTTSTRRCGCCASTSRRGEGRRASLGARRVRTRERRPARSPTRSTCASARGPTHGFDIQVGRVPPTFGAFARRTYAADNPLIGYPLAYQYLTSLRADALPANADELLRMRGRGWLSNFSVGNPAPDRGVPLVNAFRWDTGVQVHAGDRRASTRPASVTTGTLANPLRRRRQRRPADRRTRRRSARSPGLIIGASAARGAVRHADAAQAPAPKTATATSRRRPGAPTPSTRAATIWCASRRSSATGRCRVIAHPGHRPAARAPSRHRSRAATRSARASTRRARSITSAFSTGHRRTVAPDVGRAGHARSRSAAAIRCSATAAEAGVISTTRATAAACRTPTLGGGAGGASGSDGMRRRARSAAEASRPRATVSALGAVASIAALWRAGAVIGACGRAAALARARSAPRPASHPRPRRAAPRRAGRRAAADGRPSSARRADRDAHRSAALGRLPRDGAARRLRAGRAGPRGDGSAQRDVRAARARRSRPARRSTSRTATASTTTCSRSRRPRASTSAATRPASRSRCASTGRASCACSATSTRT